MSTTAPGPGVAESEIEALVGAAADAARAEVLAAHPALLGEPAVARLVERVNGLLRVDLEAAERTVEALEWLAGRLDSAEARGLACRARGNVRHYRRDYRGAIEAYDAAIQIFSRAGNRAQKAITCSSAVADHSQLGDIERALELAAEAKRIFTRQGDDLRLARLENNVAYVHTRRDEFRRALKHFEDALRYVERAGSSSDVGIALRNIAVCHQALNDFPAALAAYERARDYCREHDLPLVAAEVDYNIAYLFYLRGEYTRANQLFEQARETSRRLGDREHEALCDVDQAEIFLELNLVGEAGRLAARAVEGFEELEMAFEAAKAMTYQALARFRRGEAQEALELLDGAGRRFTSHGNRVWAALTDLQRAFILYQDRRLPEAVRLARSAHAVFLESSLPTKTALCEIVLARLALAAGEPEEAAPLVATALDRLERIGSANLAAKAWFVSGLTQERQGRRDEALEAYRRSDAALESLRSRLQTEELRIAFLQDKLAVYESLVELTLADEAAPGRAEAAFAWAEKAKSRSLADLLASGGWIAPSEGADRDAVRRLKELREELNWYYRQIDLEELKGEERSLARSDKLRAAAAERERGLVRLQRKVQSTRPELGALDDAATADPESVRALLAADHQLVEYYIARGTVYAFVLGRDLLEVRPISTADRVSKLHHQLRMQMSRFKMGEEYVLTLGDLPLRATLGILARLYDELMRPLEPLLAAEHLVVVPHGMLHSVPFQALYDGASHLLDRFSLSYAPSATVLHLCSRRAGSAGDTALVLGVPDERAPRIRDEALAVAEALPRATLRLGEEATRDCLERLGRGCRYLHIATHGFYRQDNPIFSAIQLGDGRMSLFDLYSLRLDAELAVLSGCATGLGSVEGADELVGLTRGFLHAGARSLVVSLWDVHDASAASFMAGFYRRLLAGTPLQQALRESALEIRDDRPHPYYWAPFVLIGRPGGEARQPSSSYIRRH